jgi:hypothetical protein
MMIREEPGYTGAFTRERATNALPNGTRVVKVRQDSKGDRTRRGTVGTVIGSISSADIMPQNVMYFIEWDNAPKVIVACIDWKLARHR